MCHRALRSHLPFTFLSNEETDNELQQFFNSFHKTPSSKDLIPYNTKDDQPAFSSAEDPKPDTKDDLCDEIMFADDNTSVGVVLIPAAFNLL